MNLRRPSRLLRLRDDRGATFVEYAMLVGIFCVTASAGMSVIEDNSGSKLEHVQAQVGPAPAYVEPTVTTNLSGTTIITAPPTTAAPTTAVPTTAVPTTAPPTTAAPTTAAPTTTTSTTTIAPTTTAPKPPSSGSLGNANFSVNNGGKWSASATATINDNKGKAIKNAKVTVQVTITDNKGKVLTTFTVSGDTANNGKVTVSDSGNGLKGATKATFTIITVESDGFDWDGNGATVSASA